MDADGIPTPRNEAGGRQRRSGGCWRPSRFHYLAVSEISQEQFKWLMPCFEIPDQANEEGRIIGLILVGYGELETTLLGIALLLPVWQQFRRQLSR